MNINIPINIHKHVEVKHEKETKKTRENDLYMLILLSSIMTLRYLCFVRTFVT